MPFPRPQTVQAKCAPCDGERHPSWLPSMGSGDGVGAVSQLLTWWHLQARIQNGLPALSDGLETPDHGFQPVNHAFRKVHAKGIGPTRPVWQGALAPCYQIHLLRGKGGQGVRGILRAKNLAKACTHVFVVASGKRLGVFWPQSAQPEIGPAGTA